MLSEFPWRSMSVGPLPCSRYAILASPRLMYFVSSFPIFVFHLLSATQFSSAANLHLKAKTVSTPITEPFNIEFSSHAASNKSQPPSRQNSPKQTEFPGSAATICCTQEYSFSYWSFTYPAASCGNRRGRYRQRNIPNHTNLALPAYSSYWSKGILVERPFPMKQNALILKARAYRYAIPGPRRSILKFSPRI